MAGSVAKGPPCGNTIVAMCRGIVHACGLYADTVGWCAMDPGQLLRYKVGVQLNFGAAAS